MYDILKGPDVFVRAAPGQPHKRQAIEALKADGEKVITYLRGLGKALPNDHLLVKLIRSIGVSPELNDRSFVETVNQYALPVCNALGLTSVWGHGRLHDPGILYGADRPEVIIASIDDFPLSFARHHWRELDPIRVMAHPLNDFTLPLLNGTGRGMNAKGRVVLVLNVSMLLFQWKCWWEEYVKGRPEQPMLHVFLTEYPLANLLRSHLDITLANRLMSRVCGWEIVAEENPHPFYLNFRQPVVDSLLNETATFLESGRLSFDDQISIMPCVYVDDLHVWYRLPDLAFTTQLEWAIFLARLPVLKFLVQHNKQIDSQANGSYLNQIRHWLRRLAQGRLVGKGLNGEQLKAVWLEVQRDVVPYL